MLRKVFQPCFEKVKMFCFHDGPRQAVPLTRDADIKKECL